jgi:hypothetical protein
MTPIFTFLITSAPALLIVIIPMVMTWRIVVRASRNLDTIDRTIRLGRYILPRWAAWHIPGAIYLVLAILNLIALLFIDPRIGSRYAAMGPGWETAWSLYTLLIGLPLMVVSYIAIPCSLYIWIRVWLLGRNKTKRKEHDVRGALAHLRSQVRQAGEEQRQIRDNDQR